MQQVPLKRRPTYTALQYAANHKATFRITDAVTIANLKPQVFTTLHLSLFFKPKSL
jgi:hypothetical protein